MEGMPVPMVLKARALEALRRIPAIASGDQPVENKQLCTEHRRQHAIQEPQEYSKTIKALPLKNFAKIMKQLICDFQNCAQETEHSGRRSLTPG